MKKNILAIAVSFIATAVSAQTVNVHFTNGHVIQFSSSNVDYVDFSAKAPDPTLSSGQVIDLGLSVYWASCNLGAENPEDYGNYYAWGETSPKSSYTANNYSYYDSSKSTYIDIGDDISGTEFDAATVNLGSDWRMPTKAEMKELMDNCIWKWTQIKGVNGYQVTGTNGNTIFLPAAGFNNYEKNKLLRYNTSQIGWNNTNTMTLAGNASDYYFFDGNNREYGLPIRPVTSNPNASVEVVDHTNDYLVTDKISASFAGGAYSMINDLISSGSQLMWRFKNESTESVTLTGVQLINGSTNAVGNNLLSTNVEIAAGEAKVYTITVGALGIRQPKIRFTYLYNKKEYTAEASMPEN